MKANDRADEAEDRARIGDHALEARRWAIEYLREWVRLRGRLQAMARQQPGTAIASLLLSEVRRQDELADVLVEHLGVTGDAAEPPTLPADHPDRDSGPGVAD